MWFRLDIGRRQNADPRWILPLLCRRGHVTRNEIGAIRISADETHVQIPRALKAKFDAALERTAKSEDPEDTIHIEPSEALRHMARENRREGGARRKPRDAARRDATMPNRAHASTARVSRTMTVRVAAASRSRSSRESPKANPAPSPSGTEHREPRERSGFDPVRADEDLKGRRCRGRGERQATRIIP